MNTHPISSGYSDNDHKFVAILNKKIELPKLLNALGHMTAGLISQVPSIAELKFLKYTDADGGAHPAISHYPFIVLSAKNSNQIRTVRQAAIEQSIPYNDFTNTMLGSSAQDQLEKTRATKEVNLEYFGICLFGKATDLQPMTKKFSVFQ